MLEELKKHNAIVQERIMKSFGYSDTEDFIQKGEDEVELIQKGEIDYNWELEKAVYADTAENRKLGRVGQEYHRGREKKKEDEKTQKYDIKDLTDNDTEKHREIARKYGVKLFGYEDNSLECRIESKKDVGGLKKFLKDCGLKFNSEKLFRMKGVHGTHSYEYDLSDITGKKSPGLKSSDTKDAGSSNGVNKAHEQEKRDRIKGIRYNGAGVDTDIFIDNNKTDYYKSIMKKYGVSDVGELADKLGEKDGGYDKYEKIYMKMLREIPAAAFYKERRG